MKELKFRAWDKEEQIMGVPFDLYEIGMVNGENGYDKKYFIILQYTGLHDKRGVEIYEGDILDRNDNILCVVTFEDGKFGWNIKYKHPELNQRQDYFGRSYASQEEASKLEVIGNIYESPYLLDNNSKL